MKEALEVWLDCDLALMQRVGTLSHDRGTVWFEYASTWLEHPLAFQLDPELNLSKGPIFPNMETGNFGIFLDSAPDRWGQTLMKRRELLQAKDEGRTARRLYAWDYLQGVQDITRQGALRFRPEGKEQFVAHDALAAPPVTQLAELSEIAYALTQTDREDLAQLRQWLAVLVAPGASLGGARPKANFIENDGTAWIAKFPAWQDARDVGAWEYVTWSLALKAGIQVPPAKTIKIGHTGHHSFCVQRFDRKNKQRQFYASAMTLLGAQDSEDGAYSYLDLAQFLSNHGNPEQIGSDLVQLFRRVIFNIAVGNRDDHLRNHGFLLTKHGWHLAPAFDVNPNSDKDTHVLNIDEHDNRPSLDSALATADFYRLSAAQAEQILHETLAVVRGWEAEAKQVGLSSMERLAFSSVFV